MTVKITTHRIYDEINVASEDVAFLYRMYLMAPDGDLLSDPQTLGMPL